MANEKVIFDVLDTNQEIEIDAPRERVWRALTAEMVEWWPKSFYIGAAPRRFAIEERVGGRVYEDWGDGEGALWATVTAIRRGELLQWAGDLGPEYGGPARSLSTFTLEENEGRTRLLFRDTIFGRLEAQTIDNMEKGWDFLLRTCFKTWVEQGERPERPDGVAQAG